MSWPTMQQFRFEGALFEQIHNWMQDGAGVHGLVPAMLGLKRLGIALTESVERLEDALKEIGVWEGDAGDAGTQSTVTMERSANESVPVVSQTSQSANDLSGEFAATQSRMPTPSELELSSSEQASTAVPIVGGIIDRQLRDARRDKVTNEARQRMKDWQHNANEAVNGVRPLPPVPQPVVDVVAPTPSGTEIIAGPGSTRAVAVTPAVPGPVPPGSPPPVVSGPPALLGGPGGPPVGPSPIPPPGGGAPPLPPPVGNPPSAPAPGPIGAGPAPGRPPAGGIGAFPIPLGGVGAGATAAGRRRAFGPGMYSADEITKARGGSGAAGKGGVPGVPGVPGAAGDGPDGARTGARGGPPAAAAASAGAAGSRGAAVRPGGGSLLQPAVGAGSGGDEDSEHTDKYADKSDAHFTEGIQRVAPPVIGG